MDTGLKRKKEIKRFAVWFRNGTAFVSSWLILMIGVYCKSVSYETVKTDTLLQIILWSAGASLIFGLCFTGVLIRLKSFTMRLAVFMTAIYAYDYLTFTLMFGVAFSKMLLMLFVLLLFLSCIAIYAAYSRKKGEQYTQALHEFQRQMKTLYCVPQRTQVMTD